MFIVNQELNVLHEFCGPDNHSVMEYDGPVVVKSFAQGGFLSLVDNRYLSASGSNLFFWRMSQTGQYEFEKEEQIWISYSGQCRVVRLANQEIGVDTGERIIIYDNNGNAIKSSGQHDDFYHSMLWIINDNSWNIMAVDSYLRGGESRSYEAVLIVNYLKDHKMENKAVIRWIGSSSCNALYLYEDGRAVITQDSGQVCVLRVYIGSRRASILELQSAEK
jgi:hypothetical protein